MKIFIAIALCCFLSVPAHASSWENEAKQLVKIYTNTKNYHARLSLRFAEFSLHEFKEGDWLDAKQFLNLARQYHQKYQSRHHE